MGPPLKVSPPLCAPVTIPPVSTLKNLKYTVTRRGPQSNHPLPADAGKVLPVNCTII